MSDSAGQAVFLSYASQDAAAARRICEALRAAGVEVWFDQNELIGGDAWDAKIRQQIQTCALFVPVISAITQARGEGYFRLEWKLAVDRSHLMAHDQPFLLPVVIDTTPDVSARVPPEFRAVQWTRLPGGETPAAFAARVENLLGGSELEAGRPRPARRDEGVASPSPARRHPWHPWLLRAILGAIAAAAIAIWQPWKAPSPAATQPAAAHPPTPLTEARRLTLKARALIDDDPLAVRQNFLLADELCTKAVALDVTDGEAWATAARVSLGFLTTRYDDSSQRLESARGQSQNAIRLAPESIEAGLAMAAFLLQTNEPAEAERRLRGLLVRAPSDRRIYRQLAFAVERLDRSNEASDLRQASAALPGGDQEALTDDAWATALTGRHWEAQRKLDRVFLGPPTKLALEMRLIFWTRVEGNLETARATLDTIPRQLMTEDIFAIHAYMLWLRLGEVSMALAAIDRVPRDFLEERNQKFAKGALKGRAYALEGRNAAAQIEWKRALAHVEQRLASESDQPIWRFNRGMLLAYLGRRAEAEQEFLGYRQFGERPSFAGTSGIPVIQMVLGQREEAVAELQRRLVPTDRSWPLVLSALRFEPEFAPIRDDPRVQAMIKDGLAWVEAKRTAATPAPAASGK